MKIGVDLSSAEKDSVGLFSAVEDFLQENARAHVVVYMEQECQKEFEGRYPSLPSRCQVVYTEDEVAMEDTPSSKLIAKTTSGMVMLLYALKHGEIDVAFSPGNSGALLILAKNIVGLRKRVSFPAVGILLPREKDVALLLDAGASMEFDEERILELFYLGKEYYQQISSKTPKVGLLNIGKERYKGELNLKRVDRFLTKTIAEDYCGFVEGFDIFKSDTNIFLTNAYTGNILLKSWEGFLSYIFSFLHKHYLSFSKNKEEAVKVMGDVLSFLKDNFHYSQIGAAALLGLKKPVFLGHGRTSKNAVLGALRMMDTHVSKQGKIRAYIKKRSKWVKQFKNSEG